MRSPWRVIRRMYLDRIAALVLLVALLLAGTVGALSPVPLSVSLAAGLPLLLLLLIPPVRNRRFAQRDRDRCRALAQDLLQDGARVVVLGHTHHPDSLETHGGVYLNPGSFDRLEPNGRPFVVVEGPQARLDWLRQSL